MHPLSVEYSKPPTFEQHRSICFAYHCLCPKVSHFFVHLGYKLADMWIAQLYRWVIIYKMGTAPGHGSTMSTAAISRQSIAAGDNKGLISEKGMRGSSFAKLPDEIIEQ
jgi:hypothetical protein